jgi:hypothetical protein
VGLISSQELLSGRLSRVGLVEGNAGDCGGVPESPVERGEWDPTAESEFQVRGVVARERMGTGHVQGVRPCPRSRLGINLDREALQERNPARGLRHRRSAAALSD